MTFAQELSKGDHLTLNVGGTAHVYVVEFSLGGNRYVVEEVDDVCSECHHMLRDHNGGKGGLCGVEDARGELDGCGDYIDIP